jgi:hypothetical protein
MGYRSGSPEASSFLRQPSISETAHPIAMLLTPNSRAPWSSLRLRCIFAASAVLHQAFAVRFRLSAKGPGDDTPGPRLLFVCSVC